VVGCPADTREQILDGAGREQERGRAIGRLVEKAFADRFQT